MPPPKFQNPHAQAISGSSPTHIIYEDIYLCVHVHWMRDDTRRQMPSHLRVVLYRHLLCCMDNNLELTISSLAVFRRQAEGHPGRHSGWGTHSRLKSSPMVHSLDFPVRRERRKLRFDWGVLISLNAMETSPSWDYRFSDNRS